MDLDIDQPSRADGCSNMGSSNFLVSSGFRGQGPIAAPPFGLFGSSSSSSASFSMAMAAASGLFGLGGACNGGSGGCGSSFSMSFPVFRNDSMLSPDYYIEIVDNLKAVELKYSASPNFADEVQREVTPHMRAILVDWLNEVAVEYRLKVETLFLAVNYVDRFLSQVTVPRQHLQLVGVACMMLAAKHEEIMPPTVEDFVYITDRTYRREDVISMELRILTTLGFCLTAVTARDFVSVLLEATEASELVCMLTDYLVELTLQEYSFLRFSPSVVACSGVVLARSAILNNPWCDALAFFSKLRPSDIRDCLRDIHRIWQRASSNSLQAVREKYSHYSYLRVSTSIAPCLQIPILGSFSTCGNSGSGNGSGCSTGFGGDCGGSGSPSASGGSGYGSGNGNNGYTSTGISGMASSSSSSTSMSLSSAGSASCLSSSSIRLY